MGTVDETFKENQPAAVATKPRLHPIEPLSILQKTIKHCVTAASPQPKDRDIPDHRSDEGDRQNHRQLHMPQTGHHSRQGQTDLPFQETPDEKNGIVEVGDEEGEDHGKLPWVGWQPLYSIARNAMMITLPLAIRYCGSCPGSRSSMHPRPAAIPSKRHRRSAPHRSAARATP